jgi:hypothetical protein
MLTPPDNIAGDAVALQRRNIFVPPTATSTRPVSNGGGVFGSAAECAPSEATDDYWDARCATQSGARRVSRLAAVAAAGVAALVIVALAARGPQDSVRPSPTLRPTPTVPTPKRGELPRIARPAERAKARPRRAHRKRARQHVRSSHAAPRRASPSPRTPPRPARAAPRESSAVALREKDERDQSRLDYCFEA